MYSFVEKIVIILRFLNLRVNYQTLKLNARTSNTKNGDIEKQSEELTE
jgi:hypothetical protein